MEETAAREIAKLIASRLNAEILPFQANKDALRVPLTLGGLLKMAFMLAKFIRKGIPEAREGFQIPEEFMAAVFASTVYPPAIEEFFYDSLLKSEEDPLDLRALAEGENFEQVFIDCRKEIVSTFNEIWPPPPPGRPPKIRLRDYSSLYERCERLRPMFYALLELKDKFPNRELPALLEFLSPDYPDEFVYVLKRLHKIPEWLKDCKAFARAKTNKSRARLLADLMAASDWGLASHTALQKAEEARRYMAGKQKKSCPRLKSVPILNDLRKMQKEIP